MNLKKTQELERLKMEHESIWQKVKRKRQKLKSATLDQAQQDFKKFFREQEFTIEEGEARDSYHRPNFTKQVVATFGKMRMVLSIPDYETVFLGYYSILQLDIINGSAQKEVSIGINRIGSKWRSETSIIPKTEEEKLDKEIKEATQQNEKLTKELETFEETKMGFKIFKVKENHREITEHEFPMKQEFQTLKELLESVFN